MFQSSQAAGSDGSMATLPFLVSIDDTGSAPEVGDKGIFRRTSEDGSVREIPLTVLRDNLQRTVNALQQVIGEITIPENGMPLRQVQVGFEVTASGGITLVGTSAQLAAKGAITLTFGS